MRAATGLALCLAMAVSVPAEADALTEWEDLHGRCRDALVSGETLDLRGLVGRTPDLRAKVVDQSPFGLRIDREVLRTSARTVPTGIWGTEGGRFEMQLLEFPTRPGTRAICEVRLARGAGLPGRADRIRIAAAFGGAEDGDETDAAPSGAMRRTAARAEANPRGCPLVESLTMIPAEGYFRSSVGERAGMPSCGGRSFFSGRRRIQPEVTR